MNRNPVGVRLWAGACVAAVSASAWASSVNLMWVGPVAALMTTATQQGGAPMVEITKSCPNLRYLGREATFEITVTNRGNAAAQNVTVTDVIEGGVQFLGADNNGQRQGNNLVWNIGVLEAGQSRVLQARYGCNTIGRVRNTATVSYCAQAVASCEMDVRGIAAILLECVDEPDPVEVGTNTTYTIVVVNQGSSVGTNIRIACTLPPQEEYVSSDGPTTGTAAGKQITFEPLPTLAPAARATWKVTVRGVATGDVRFAVEMTSDQISAPVNETESTHIYD